MILPISLLLLLRFGLLSSPGYIHPDEFCQGPDVVAGHLPWEFESQHAVRSPLYPWTLSRRWVESVWWSPRWMPMLLSLVVDAWVWRAAGHRAWFALATAWPMLILQTRSFSNGVESALVAAMRLVSRDSIWFGCLGALGVFARFTFPAFVLPLTRLPPSWRVVFASLVTAAAIVAVDSYYYGRFVVTPLNAFLYNLDSSNLALHGLHPRYLHALVNLPLLLGPVLVLRLRPSAQWLVPLALLSLAPHQEPRFLLPLVAPAIVTGATTLPWRTWEVVLHGGYHAVCVGFFGFFHQAGIVSAVQSLRPGDSVAFWKTYPPPMHLVPAGVKIVQQQDDADFVISPVRPPGDFSIRGPRCWWPHVSTENLPSSVSTATLCEWVR